MRPQAKPTERNTIMHYIRAIGALPRCEVSTPQLLNVLFVRKKSCTTVQVAVPRTSMIEIVELVRSWARPRSVHLLQVILEKAGHATHSEYSIVQSVDFEVLQSWDRRRCFSKLWLQDGIGSFGNGFP